MICLDTLLITSIIIIPLVFGESPKFRILAPEFICPKDQDSVIEKPDNTIITLQTESGSDLHITWTVRWNPLPALTQRFTIMLWKSVRALQEKLNRPQPEPFIYVIENTELLSGVNYTFNVTASVPDGNVSYTSFYIDNVQGDQKLMIEGRSDMFSLMLVGGQIVYSDMEFILEAQVSTCHQTQDYYFTWSVNDKISGSDVNVTEAVSSRLEIPAYSLRSGHSYQVTCQLFRHSNGEFITQTSLPVEVLHRAFQVYLNVDFLIITINRVFNIYSNITSDDFFDNKPSFKWQCTYEGEPCESFESSDNGTLTFPYGLPNAGKYEILLVTSADIVHQTATAKCIITSVEATLPVLEIDLVQRILNEDTTISLTASAANLSPSCTLTWYFATEDMLQTTIAANNSSDDYQHGDALTDSVTIYSLEENFLNELSDYSNETEWRQITATLDAAAGRARFVAQCGCSLTFNCDNEGTAYADINFKLNASPKAGRIYISPEKGTAMETLFRISTRVIKDADRPLRYSFYCKVGINDTLMLNSYLDHLAVETFLPYIPGGTEIWLEVCDSLGACSSGDVNTINLMAGQGRTVSTLIEVARAYLRRCEILLLKRLVVFAIVTYTNNNQAEPFLKFTAALRDFLLQDQHQCNKIMSIEYDLFLHWLVDTGIDIISG